MGCWSYLLASSQFRMRSTAVGEGTRLIWTCVQKAVLFTTSASREHRATPWSLSISWSVSQWQCCLSVRKKTIRCCAIKRWAHWHTYLCVWAFIHLVVGHQQCVCMCLWTFNIPPIVTLVTHKQSQPCKSARNPSTLVLPQIKWDLSLSLCRQGLCCIPDEMSELSLRALCLYLCVCLCTALSVFSPVTKSVCVNTHKP